MGENQKDPRLLDGKALARTIRTEVRDKVTELSKLDIVPGLAVILVGEDPASQVYVASKQRACEKAGIFSITERQPASVSEAELLTIIDRYNNAPEFHGILVQMPLPDHIDPEKVIAAISPFKDVDGFHPVNLGRLMRGIPLFVPCTPEGIHQLLLRYEVPVEGAHVVIVGRSNLVGKPLANILIQKSPRANATVTVCHTKSGDLAAFTGQADILVVAVGRAGCVTGDMVREGAVIIDVGINRVPDSGAKRGYRLVGDVDFQSCYEKVSKITPVPGGVGPMTIAMLLSNTVKAAILQMEKSDSPMN